MNSQHEGTTPPSGAGYTQLPSSPLPRQRLGGSTYLPDPESIAAQSQPAATLGTLVRPPTFAPTTSGRRRRRRRRWYRRPIIVLPTLAVVVVLLVVGFVMQRATSTISVVQSVSTPPPVVSLQIDPDPQLSGEAPGAAQIDPLAQPSGNQSLPNVQIDTQPALEALAAETGGNGNGDGVFGDIRDRASDVTDVGHGAAVAAGLQNEELTPLNILLMGVDARPGESIDVGVRPDVLAVLHLNPTTGTCRLLSIPRDSRVELPGYGQSKINHALAVGGVPYQTLVTEHFLDLTLDRYALIDFAGVVSVVDEVGGVDVNVTEPFEIGGVTFEAGPQTLDGDDALLYVRYRGGPTGDFGRIERQQQVLRSLMSKASSLNPVDIVQSFLPLVRDHFRTNLSPAEMVALGAHFRGTCTSESLDVMTMDGTIATFDDPLFKMPLSFVVISPDEARRKVEELTKGS